MTQFGQPLGMAIPVAEALPPLTNPVEQVSVLQSGRFEVWPVVAESGLPVIKLVWDIYEDNTTPPLQLVLTAEYARYIGFTLISAAITSLTEGPILHYLKTVAGWTEPMIGDLFTATAAMAEAQRQEQAEAIAEATAQQAVATPDDQS